MNTFWVKEDKRLYGNSMGIAMVTFYQSTGDTIFEWSWWKSASSCNSYRSIIFRWKICMFSSGKRNIHEVSVLKAVLGENFHLNFMTQWLIMHELFSCRLEMLVMISHFGTFIEDGKIACEYLFFFERGRWAWGFRDVMHEDDIPVRFGENGHLFHQIIYSEM